MALAFAGLLLAGTLSGCGGGGQQETKKDVDLTQLYAGMETDYEWGDGYMVDIEGDLLESYYPGLSEITTKQLVAKVPMMSAAVNEVVFLECETEEDAAKAAEILQARIDYQVGDEENIGGAFYPESIEAWKKGEVIQQGTYAAMVASAEHKEDIVSRLNEALS